MSQKIKYLFAIHLDAQGRAYRTKIAEGTTADFTQPIGFQVENVVIRGENEDGHDPWEGLSGTYPIINTDSFKNVEGKLLTLCDATFTNKEQRESFKSLVRDILWKPSEDSTLFALNTFKKSVEQEGVLTQE